MLPFKTREEDAREDGELAGEAEWLEQILNTREAEGNAT